MSKKQKKNLFKGIRQDPKLYDQIIAYWNRSKDYIKDREIFDQAELYKKLYENEPWGNVPGMNRPEHLSKIKVPIANDVIETGLSVATARIPMPEVDPEIEYETYQNLVAPEGMEREEFETEIKDRANKYGHGLQAEMIKQWRQDGLQKLMRCVYRTKGIAGTDFVNIEFDGQKIITEVCGIYHIFPTPGIFSIREHTRDPFIYAPIMTVSKAKEKYGLEDIGKGAVNSQKELSKELHENLGTGGIIRSAINFGNAMRKKASGEKSADDDSCIPLRCYMPAGDETEEYEDEELVLDDNGEIVYGTENDVVEKQTVTKTRLKFPSGYKCVVIIYGHKNWIVKEYDCPYAPYEKPQPPFVRIAGYLPYDDFWGVSEIKQIENIIAQICLVVSNLSDVIRKTGNAPLVKSKGTVRIDAKNDIDAQPLYAMPGDIWEEVVPGSMRWLAPPSGNFDAKWFLEWMFMVVDRVTHLSDAMRGFNQYAQDSGKKIAELRSAALGTFGPKLDEVVEFCTEIYRMWAWIYINMYPEDKIILQKEEDEQGEMTYNEFMPSMGKMFKFYIDVSARSLIPDDPEARFQETVALYQLGQERTGLPLLPAEFVIDAAQHIEEKHRAKKWLAQQQKQIAAEAQKEELLKQFEMLGQQADQVEPGGPEEEQLFNQMAQIMEQIPEVWMTPQFKALPDRVREGLGQYMAKGEAMEVQDV